MTTAGGIAQNPSATPTTRLGYARPMSGRALPPAGRRARIVAVVAGATLAGALASPVSHAQPAPAAELERAKDLYRTAEAAMKDGRFEDAARDYGVAYAASK